MHISFAGKKVRLLALAVCIFMIIFVSANWRLYLDPTLDLQGGTILFVLSLLAGPTAGFLIIFKPSVDQKYQAFANTALFFIMPILTIQMVETFNENFIWWFSVPTFSSQLYGLPCFLSGILPDHRTLPHGGTDRKYFPLRLVSAELFY